MCILRERGFTEREKAKMIINGSALSDSTSIYTRLTCLASFVSVIGSALNRIGLEKISLGGTWRIRKLFQDFHQHVMFTWEMT